MVCLPPKLISDENPYAHDTSFSGTSSTGRSMALKSPSCTPTTFPFLKSGQVIHGQRGSSTPFSLSTRFKSLCPPNTHRILSSLLLEITHPFTTPPGPAL